MIPWLIVSGLLTAALLAAWLCLRPRRTKDAPDQSLIASWRTRADELRRRLEQSPDDEWAWLWRIRLRVMTFLLGRAVDCCGDGADAASPAAATPDDPGAAPVMTAAQKEEAFAAYTRDRERARMDWTPPWSRGGDSLANVLSRVTENTADAPAVRAQRFEQYDRRFFRGLDLVDQIMRGCLLALILFAAAFMFAGFAALQFAYYPAIVAIARDGLSKAMIAGYPAASYIGVVLAMNTGIVIAVVQHRRRADAWKLLALLGIVGVVAACCLRRKVAAAKATRPVR